jgi:hypothetical protein
VAVTGWIAGVMDAADGELADRLGATLAVWADLAQAIAAELEEDFDPALAQQLFRLLWELDKVQPLGPETLAAKTRAECIAALMRHALAEPAERGWLASAVAQFLPQAVAVTPQHAVVLRQALAPNLMATWPTAVLRHFVNGIGSIAAGDAQVATDLLLAVWRFEETSDQVTALIRGVLTLTSNRQQDFDNVKWLTGEKFYDFVTAAGLRHAVLLVAEATALHDPYLPAYPIALGAISGKVFALAISLKFDAGHGAALAIVDTFIRVLRQAELDATEISELVGHLVAVVTHPEVWRLLLIAAVENPEVHGRAFFPVLLSGGLLVHTDTRAAAGGLIRALSPIVSDTEHDELELAIRDAPQLLPTLDGEREKRIVDQLLGCLDPARVRDPALSDRLAKMIGNNELLEIPVPGDMEMIYESTTLRDYLGDEGHEELADSDRDVIADLRKSVDAATQGDAPELIPPLERALRRALHVPQARLGLNTTPSKRVWQLIIDAADVLARKSTPTPDSDLGASVVSLLLEAAGTPATEDDEELVVMSWSPTGRRSGVSGLASLWRRDEWRSSVHADAIRSVLRDMLVDQDEVNRLHAAQIALLLDPDRTRHSGLFASGCWSSAIPTWQRRFSANSGRSLTPMPTPWTISLQRSLKSSYGRSCSAKTLNQICLPTRSTHSSALYFTSRCGLRRRRLFPWRADGSRIQRLHTQRSARSG